MIFFVRSRPLFLHNSQLLDNPLNKSATKEHFHLSLRKALALLVYYFPRRAERWTLDASLALYKNGYSPKFVLQYISTSTEYSSHTTLPAEAKSIICAAARYRTSTKLIVCISLKNRNTTRLIGHAEIIQTIEVENFQLE